MNQINCDSLDEKLFVEKYIRENISSLAKNDEVLGGTWYVISVTVNTPQKISEIVYEDGHIQSRAKISYSYDKTTQNIDINDFEIIN